jgi:hypothetical protein
MTQGPRLLLCTDLDRTLLPNGVEPESPEARKRFRHFVEQHNVTLAYVTGRHLKLVESAIKNYRLPKPNFVITDVGTKIYQNVDDKWQPVEAWEQEIDGDWVGYTHLQLRDLFRDISALQLQETSKQNTHKLSYYVALHVDRNALLQAMQQRLDQHGVNASLVWSVDEPKGIGLLDVLPRNATKLHAIEFLQQQLGFGLDETVFAGDSGNDLPVMESGIPSVLVANATAEVKQEAIQSVTRHGNQHAFYIAYGKHLGMNGNYSAGILEGVYHYCPVFREHLTEEVVS